MHTNPTNPSRQMSFEGTIVMVSSADAESVFITMFFLIVGPANELLHFMVGKLIYLMLAIP